MRVVNQTMLKEIPSAMGRSAEQAVMKVCDSVGEVVTENVNYLLAQEKEDFTSTTANRISTSVTRY